MGGKSSKRPQCCGENSQHSAQVEDDGYVSDQCNNSLDRRSKGFLVTKAPTVFVTERFSPSFIDEDGDCADEFYEEIPARATKNRGPYLVKITSKLKAQGPVPYTIPRLNPDLPFIMYELNDCLEKFNLQLPGTKK